MFLLINLKELMAKKQKPQVSINEVSLEVPQEDTTMAHVEPTQEVVEVPQEVVEVPQVDELYVPIKKPMKVVKTVKTGVGQQILQLLADGVLSNKEIVAKVLEDNPLRKTTYACVAWYQSQVRAGKIDLPEPQEEVMDEETTEE